jgi:hypothetical protein
MRVLILGGYGFFGSRIAAALARDPRIELIVAGRNADKATALAYQLGLTAEHAVKLDATAPNFTGLLRKFGVKTLIHTAGPFQGQGYEVARAAIAAGSNYLDLADGREFVGGIARLDGEARAAGVSVVSGASSLPALTSAVIDRYLPQFSRLDAVRTGITSGAVIPGPATLRGVLGYCGKPFRVLENGAWGSAYGWLDTRRHEFPRPVGARWLGRCDVPDLDLLPQRYPSLKSVSFHAGFASDTAHRLIEKLALQVRAGKLADAAMFTGLLSRLGRWMQPLFSDRGAMFVRLEGLDDDGVPLALTWNLVARENHGPRIPCGPAISLARKLAAGVGVPAGAMPCMGLLSVEDILDTLKGLAIRELPPPGV